jgi:hypothetical protein
MRKKKRLANHSGALAVPLKDARPNELYSREVDIVLSRSTSKILEATAVLQLCSDVLTRGCEPEDQARLMSAIDAAVRILRPIPDDIGCRVSMERAIGRMRQEAHMEVGHG